MSKKEEVPEDVRDCAESLTVLNSSKPTVEECKKIQLWKDIAAQKKNTPSSSSPAMELEIIPKTRYRKTDRLKALLVKSPSSNPIRNRKVDCCLDVGTKSRPPLWLYQFMRDKNGVEAKMIIEKSLTATDLNPNHGRLSMPYNQLVDKNFLTDKEETIISEGNSQLPKKGVDATILDYELHRWEVNLRIWNMNNRLVYNLVTGWNQVVQDMELQEKDNIRLWSFHSNGQLYFALVLVPPSTGSDKSKSGKRNRDP